VNASALGASDVLTFNGSAEKDGYFNLKGGAGNDTFTLGRSSAALTGSTAAQASTPYRSTGITVPVSA